MTDEVPPPLKSTGETPDELVRALRALGRADERDIARLARVGARLEAAAVASSASSSWLKSLLGSKLGMVGVIVGLGALGALGYSLNAKKEVSTAHAPAVPAPIEAPAPVNEVAPEPVRALEAPREHTAVPTTQERARVSRPQRSRVPVAEAIEDSSPAATRQSERTAPVEQPEAEAERPERAQADKPIAQPHKPAPRLSEAALIYEARKAAASEPDAALRYLDEHAQRFPSGTLVPEREVLAIEVLRRLGRSAEAARRLRAFEDRYPGSIHLRRLVQKPSDD
jgi:hypothetical protein